MGTNHNADASSAHEQAGLNFAVIRGLVCREPSARYLPSGDQVVTVDVRIAPVGGRKEVIRVSWINAPQHVSELVIDDDVVVVGRMRSYWSGRRSETDLLATSISKARSAGKVRKALVAGMASLQEACP
jgi:hypothetical protein